MKFPALRVAGGEEQQQPRWGPGWSGHTMGRQSLASLSSKAPGAGRPRRRRELLSAPLLEAARSSPLGIAVFRGQHHAG